MRSAEHRNIWKQVNELGRQRKKMIESNNSQNFSEEPDERTNQNLSDILKNGFSFTIDHPPVTSPDGKTVTKETTTVTMPPPQWLIEGILDGKI